MAKYVVTSLGVQSSINELVEYHTTELAILGCKVHYDNKLLTITECDFENDQLVYGDIIYHASLFATYQNALNSLNLDKDKGGDDGEE